jgi:hypothetical protein
MDAYRACCGKYNKDCVKVTVVSGGNWKIDTSCQYEAGLKTRWTLSKIEVVV